MYEAVTRKGRRRAVTGAIALLALAACAGPAVAADLERETRARGTLRIAVEGTYPPFNFKDPKSGLLTGYDVDVARLLAGKLGLTPQFVLTEWTAILPAVQSGKVDVAISQVIMTPERLATFDFSAPYTYSGFQLIVRKNERATYRRLEDLGGRVLGVREGSVFAQRARAVAGLEVKGYPAVPENLQDLAFGRIDAVLDDSLMVHYLVKNTQLPIKAGPRIGGVQRVGVAFRKGQPRLKAALDRALGQARASGQLRALSLKWFGIDASNGP